jgi:hypothetical protein
MDKPSDVNCRFGFGFGRFTGKVYLDNVSIVKEATTLSEKLTDAENTRFVIYPNPTSGEIKITSHNNQELPVSIKLYTLQGQLLANLCSDRPMAPKQQISFNLKDNQLTRGIYLITISTHEQKITRKLVVN